MARDVIPRPQRKPWGSPKASVAGILDEPRAEQKPQPKQEVYHSFGAGHSGTSCQAHGHVKTRVSG